jgi:hypothetical protein
VLLRGGDLRDAEIEHPNLELPQPIAWLQEEVSGLYIPVDESGTVPCGNPAGGLIEDL